jgi:4-carboxymuconolactone decarboxylase
MSNEKAELGFKVLEQMMGAEKAESVRATANSDSFGAAMVANIMESCFADIWGREGLSRRDRSLVTLGVLIARETSFELSTHIEIGMRHGLTAEEIEEVVLQTMPYAGLVSTFHATNVARETLQKLGHLNETGVWASMEKVLDS